MRAYLPMTTASLAEAWERGALETGTEMFTPEVEDDEDAEYAALSEAAEASAELVGEGGRRVVVVVEIGRLTDDLPLRRVVAVHADVPGARRGDDLGWYATQEVAALLEA